MIEPGYNSKSSNKQQKQVYNSHFSALRILVNPINTPPAHKHFFSKIWQSITDRFLKGEGIQVDNFPWEQSSVSTMINCL